jgi:hypothetical protein
MSMVGWVRFLLLLVGAHPALADISLLPERSFPLPGGGHPREFTDLSGLSRVEKRKGVEALAAELKRQYARLFSLERPAQCLDPSAPDYALSLRVKGRYDECLAYAKECGPGISSPEVLVQGALCAFDRSQFPEATALFEEATHPRFASAGAYRRAVLEFAMFEMYGLRPGKVDEILLLDSQLSPEQRALWKAVLLRSGGLATGRFTKKEVDDFLASRLPQEDPFLRTLLLAMQIDILADEDRLSQAFEKLLAYAAEIRDPLQWYYKAYLLVYRGSNTDFGLARLIYDAYDPYAHPFTSLPVEFNTYTYGQLYGSVCAKSLSQGPLRASLQEIKAKFRSGALGRVGALAQIEALLRASPGKADLLTVKAGLLSLGGEREEAFQVYWQAHRACRYYHRANWGLTLEKRFRRYSAMPDYAENEQRVKDTVRGLTVPSAAAQYYRNWGALAGGSREKVIFGARVWLPYYGLLAGNGRRTYIKFPFELLSESPGRESVADRRVTDPIDHRLWDDIRGIGGNPVVADLEEISNAVHGDYNLLAHEMAHQFHGYLDDSGHVGSSCITRLYGAAKGRGLFANTYSGSNEREYFAEGVTYSIVPPGAPERYGINRSWYQRNDSLLLRFIDRITAGKVDGIHCGSRANPIE